MAAPTIRGMHRYDIYDIESEELLAADLDDLQYAYAVLDHLVEVCAAAVEQQLTVNGEGHSGGVEIRLALHDAGSGELLATAGTWTGSVPARRRSQHDR